MTNTKPTTAELRSVLLLVVVALIALPTPTQGSFIDQPLFLSLSLSHTHKRLASTWSTSHAHHLTTSNSPLPGAIRVSGAGGPFIAPLMNYLTDAYQVLPEEPRARALSPSSPPPTSLSLSRHGESDCVVCRVAWRHPVRGTRRDDCVRGRWGGSCHRALEEWLHRTSASFLLCLLSVRSPVLRVETQKNEKGDEKKMKAKGFNLTGTPR
jgi:hypothetical protein